MKRTLTVIFSLFLLFCSSFTVSADTSWTSTKEVNLEKGQNRFNVQITIDQPKPYAGAEFGIQTPQGVTVESVTYNKETAKVLPTEARGLTWFSYYSGENDFTGKVIATLDLEYQGTNNTSLIIDNISVYTKEGSAVGTEKITPRKVVKINRQGATNPVKPLDPPKNTDKVSSDQSTNKGGNSSNQSTSTSGSTNSNSAQSNQNTKVPKNEIVEKEEGKDSNDIQEIDGLQGTNKPSDKGSINTEDEFFKTGVLVLLISSVAANLIFGYFYIKNKKRRNDNA